jgi:hypothetical protein
LASRVGWEVKIDPFDHADFVKKHPEFSDAE